VDPSQDYRWLLSDRQINAQTDEAFVHIAHQPLTSAGVQYGSHIMIQYDPTCEALTFHWARLWRGTNQLNRLDPSKIRLSQTGLDSENFLFSSQKTAIVLLDDVRVGDIVDYAYTITGGNPALEGKFTGLVRLQFPQPVERAATRLLWPAPRRLYMKDYLATLQPTTVRKSNLTELTWDLRHVPGLRPEPPMPVWYDPFPSVQLSEFRTWAAVNRWALGRFTVTNAPSPELARKINEWRKSPAPADRVLAALRFVQEEIRYLGLEDGAAGYEPALPSAVFDRRFGDCQDKTLLLVTILRSLKMEAFPVLVSSRRRQEVAQLQPSPTLFDHAIVQVNLEGQSFWLDPTATYERGLLSERCWPNYGCGLRVGPGVTTLASIPPCPVQPKTTVREYLNIADLNQESTVQIVTLAEGPDANRLREHFATTPPEDIERENLNAYARLYPRIRRAAPLLYGDDELQNRIQTTEAYAISGMWSRLPGEAFYHCHIDSVNVDDALVKPEVSLRSMPLGITWPVHQVFRAEMLLPPSWPINASTITIRNPAFFFQKTVGFNNGKMILGYEYRSLGDAVAPEAVPAYLRDLNSATEALGFTVAGL
jgi:transglutaminase-like putative cysteine protease